MLIPGREGRITCGVLLPYSEVGTRSASTTVHLFDLSAHILRSLTHRLPAIVLPGFTLVIGFFIYRETTSGGVFGFRVLLKNNSQLQRIN